MQRTLGWLKTAWHLTSLLLLTVLTLRLWRNLRFLRWAQAQTQPLNVPYPRVSVLVPARNEAATISECVHSLMQQVYLNTEVILLDDASTDGTSATLDALAERYPRLRVIHAKDAPPAGWNGKSYACQRLADAASGDWLLFTDADTIHSRYSVVLGMTQAQTLRVSFLSAFPYQLTKSWSEKITVSFIMDFLPLIGLDLEGIFRATSTATAANGQYMLVRTNDYRTLGGHAAIAHELVDDIALARRFRENGRKTALVDGTRMVSCRMYRSGNEVWAGFSKNILLGLSTSSLEGRRRWTALPFAWGFACLFVTPFLLLFDRTRGLALLEIGWLAAMRVLVGRKLERPAATSVPETLTTPLGAWSVMALGLRALYRRWRSREIEWKGRRYTV